MASDWSTFESNMKPVYDMSNTQMSIDELSDYHATEYVTAVKAAQILMTSSKVSIGITKDPIKSAYKKAFTDLFNEKTPISPNYKGNDPNPNQAESRKKIEDIFLPVATAICTEWLKEIFTPATAPPPYVSPTSGYQVLIPGKPDALAKDLAKAFYIAQSELDNNTAYNLFITLLIAAYTKHLLTISGIFNGLIPAAPSPIPGPPFPWIAVT
jgi:hypothetical protein